MTAWLQTLSPEFFATVAAAFGAVTAICTTVGMLVSLRNGRKADKAAEHAASARRSAEETKATVDSIDIRIDGRLSKLIESLEAKGVVDVELARRDGIIEGKESK